MYYLGYILGVILSGFYNLQYRFRFRDHSSARIDQKTIYVHIPKTGGTAVAETLGMSAPGHFTIKEREKAAGKADKIVVTFRDPIDRLISIWKYSKMELLGTINSPLKILRRYDSLDKFINSGVFAAFNKHHYFFRTQKSYMDGYEKERHQLIVLNQETLAEDVKKKLQYNIAVVNKSPNVKILLSEKSMDFLKKLYVDDYKYISEMKDS